MQVLVFQAHHRACEDRSTWEDRPVLQVNVGVGESTAFLFLEAFEGSALAFLQ